jgi:hypothetical protein
MRVEDRHWPVIEQIGRRDRRINVVELGEAYLRVDVEESLLVNARLTLKRAAIEGASGAGGHAS